MAPRGEPSADGCSDESGAPPDRFTVDRRRQRQPRESDNDAGHLRLLPCPRDRVLELFRIRGGFAQLEPEQDWAAAIQEAKDVGPLAAALRCVQGAPRPRGQGQLGSQAQRQVSVPQLPGRALPLQELQELARVRTSLVRRAKAPGERLPEARVTSRRNRGGTNTAARAAS